MTEAPTTSEPSAGPPATRRRRTTQLLAGLLALLLGVGLVAATRPGTEESAFEGARESDLVQLLDDLDQRATRIELQRQELLAAEARLGSDDDAARLAEVRRRLEALEILAGTAPATGPGITLTIADPERRIEGSTLLSAVNELRDAGARAISIGDERVVADTWFGEGERPGSVLVSGTTLTPPYVVLVVGDPQTLATALRIPGGVEDSVRAAGGSSTVVESQDVTVSALHPLRTPQYASPVPTSS